MPEPPVAHEVERAVLGAMLCHRDAVGAAIEILRPEDFHSHAYRKMFEAALTVDDQGLLLDITTLRDELEKRGHLDAVGGYSEVIDIAASVFTAANARQHAIIIRDKACRRRLLSACTDTANRISEREITESTDDLYRAIGEIQTRHDSAIRTAAELVHAADAVINEYQANRGKPRISWGIPSLDRMTGGLRAGDYNIIAARPSFGKTTLALNIALSLGHHDVPVGIFTAEMTDVEIMESMICIASGIDSIAMRNGTIGPDDYARLGDAAGTIAELPIYVDRSRDISIHQMKARVRRMVHTYQVKVVIVDYLQMLKGPKSPNREQEVSAISRGLKVVAQECGVSAIVLSQLSRSVEHRQDHRPELADLRDSGSIEQDADLVVMPYRPSYYHRAAHPQKNVLFVRKQRRGPTGRVDCVFDMTSGRFGEAVRPLPPDWYDDEPDMKGADRG